MAADRLSTFWYAHQFQHTATRRWLLPPLVTVKTHHLFQHTATRRWLLRKSCLYLRIQPVSTHSHPKVAACADEAKQFNHFSFNTQPPEGGCILLFCYSRTVRCFNTQPPEGGCPERKDIVSAWLWFQHTATRRWLPVKLVRWVYQLMFQHTATRRWLLADTHTFKCLVLFQHTATRRWLHNPRW